MIKISVIIPYYDATGSIKETFKKGLFQALKDQTNKDFEVLIVNDCPPYPITESDLEGGDLDITILNLEKNYGVGMAREFGKAHAKGEYVAFIDNDDTVGENFIDSFIQNIEDEDIIVSNFLEQTRQKNEKGEYLAIKHEKDRTWMHGKCYRRAFLEENEIHFHPMLRYSEDAYFNNIAFVLSKKTKDIKEFTYIWCQNENSITRNNNREYNTKYFCDYIKSTRASLNNLMNRCQKKPELYGFVISIAINTIGYIYYYFQNPMWKSEKAKKSVGYKQAIEQFKIFYEQYNGMYDLIESPIFYDAMTRERALLYQGQPFIERQTFKQFIKGLGLKTHKVFD